MSNTDNILASFAEGFEEVEALAAVDVLRCGSQPATIVSITGSLAVKDSHDVTIQADTPPEELQNGALPKVIALPGGLIKFNECELLPGSTCCRHEAGGTIAAICASLRALGVTDIGNGKTRTACYPGCEKRVPGFVLTGTNVEVCGHIITGRGPVLALLFASRLLKEAAGRKTVEQIAAGFLYSLWRLEIRG